MSYSIIATLHESPASIHRDRVVFRSDDGLYRTGKRCQPPKSFYGRVDTFFKPLDFEEYLYYTLGARMKACLSRWNSIVDRCFLGHAVLCDEWRNYINFAKWFEKETERFTTDRLAHLEIDKDLFQQTERKCYSPKDCCILPKGVNVVIKFGKRKIYKKGQGYSVILHNQVLFAESKEDLLSLYKSKGLQEVELFKQLYGDYLTPRIIQQLTDYFNHGEKFLIQA